MRVTFFSNFLNHHQTPFCNELYKYLGNDFTFVSTEKMPSVFLVSGYQDYSDYPYNLNSFENNTSYNKALQLGIESDIVISGSAPEFFIKERIKKNKHTFRYSERVFKQGAWRLFDPRVLFALIRYHSIYRKKNLYMLCSSAYTANDLDLVFAYPQKKYKWGYFTEVKEINIEQIINQKPFERIEILWAARFIGWKHPELAVNLAYELKNKGYNFHLNMIGIGELSDFIRKLILKLDLNHHVSVLGGMPNSQVISYMQKSNIYIFTSDRNEGWGAVLNEAMSSGCAVVASSTIGAVPFLLNHEKNGLVFKSGSLSSLLKQTEKLILDTELRNRLSKNAYNTLVNEWSPKIAASNFLLFSKSILDDQIITIKEGPCSKAIWTKKNFWKKNN